jgi:sterol desaturase/sphingolipid hydroxylase (fatty acid hydroxylase superfamily)
VSGLALRWIKSRADTLESLANATLGLIVSTLAVLALRALGLWGSLPAFGVSLIFFGVSFARSRVLRWLFRRIGN